MNDKRRTVDTGSMSRAKRTAGVVLLGVMAALSVATTGAAAAVDITVPDPTGPVPTVPAVPTTLPSHEDLPVPVTVPSVTVPSVTVPPVTVPDPVTTTETTPAVVPVETTPVDPGAAEAEPVAPAPAGPLDRDPKTAPPPATREPLSLTAAARKASVPFALPLAIMGALSLYLLARGARDRRDAKLAVAVTEDRWVGFR